MVRIKMVKRKLIVRLNERITEDIVRSHFKACGLRPDEQASSNPAIQKLLARASKSGDGLGKPDFIFEPGAGVVVVIECKAEEDKHASPTLDKYKDFAMDGALCYASYLAKEYNVIAIGASGQKEPLKISTYLVHKGTGVRQELPISTLLTPTEYEARAHDNPDLRKRTQADLLKSAVELHNYLRDNAKLSETEKPLLVAGVLIALTDNGFEAGFSSKRTARSLAGSLYETIKQLLNDANLPDAKITNMMQPFSFILTHPELAGNDKDKPLLGCITQIHENVKPFLRHYADVDIVGQFYGEFLSYTGGDKKGLGIVLTPKHICGLFVKLAGVNQDTRLLDTCSGTGGFLIAGMKHMISLAGDNPKKIKAIKEHQLIGIEQAPNMFALAAANMILRGDGKANLYSGSCFGQEANIRRDHKPTAVILNPPYSQKGAGLDELTFIKCALNSVEPGSKCVAIVPMSCVIQPSALKKELIERHTLEAVMSLPDELFYPVGVVTCCIVFTAHQPHPLGYKTWFAYWKDDGFEKTRMNGRQPRKGEDWNKWEQDWIASFIARDAIPGYTTRQAVTADDEWCAEAYLETDYSKITKADFAKFVALAAANRTIAEISK
jgi:type I restriction enzyme M protein